MGKVEQFVNFSCSCHTLTVPKHLFMTNKHLQAASVPAPMQNLHLTPYKPYTTAFWLMTEWSVVSLCNPDLSVIVVVVVVICEHSSWPHAWSNKVHTLHAHAAISCIVAHQKLYHSDLYLLYSSHICMFILMSIVHEVINIATSNLTETCI